MKSELSILFKALSDENRLKILTLLLSGETCSCTLVEQLPISQPTLSYHLKWLHDVGLTTSYKDGIWMKHKVNKEKLDLLITFLTDLQSMEEKSCK